MTKTEYNQVKAKVLQRFEAEAAPAIARRDRDLDALERVWQLAGDAESGDEIEDNVDAIVPHANEAEVQSSTTV